MLKRLNEHWKYFIYKIVFPFLAVNIGKNLITLVLKTCKWQIEGLDEFKKIGSKDKCILMLWHNRLVAAPFILTRYAPEFFYAAFISNSRDGELISSIVDSYKIGKTIRVSHNARHQALKQMIDHLEKSRDIIVITPDGPRGPKYKIKPGVALAALETSAQVFILNWTANRMWEMNSWDGLRIPKPFSKIKVYFEKSIDLNKKEIDLQHAHVKLQENMTNVTLE